jgi:hypothetical protein
MPAARGSEGLVNNTSELPAVTAVLDSVTRHHAANIRMKMCSVLVPARFSDSDQYSKQAEVPSQMGRHEGVIKVT